MPSVKERAAMFAAKTSPPSIENRSESGSRKSSSVRPSLELPMQQSGSRATSDEMSKTARELEPAQYNQENVPPNGSSSSEEKTHSKPLSGLTERTTENHSKTASNATTKLMIKHKPSASVVSSLTARNNDATDANSTSTRRATTSVFSRLAGNSKASSNRNSTRTRSSQPKSPLMSTKPAATSAARSAVVAKSKSAVDRSEPTGTPSKQTQTPPSRGLTRTITSNISPSSARPTSSSSSGDRAKTVPNSVRSHLSERLPTHPTAKKDSASHVMPKIRNTERVGTVVANRLPNSGQKKMYSEKEVGELQQELVNQMEKLKLVHAEEIINIRQAFDSFTSTEINSLDIPAPLKSEDQIQSAVSQVNKDVETSLLQNGELSSLREFEHQQLVQHLKDENVQQLQRVENAEKELASSYAVVKHLETEIKRSDETYRKDQDREFDRLRTLHEKDLAAKSEELRRMEHDKEEAFSKTMIALKSEVEAMEKENEFLRKKIEQQVDSRKQEVESIEHIKKSGSLEQQSLKERVLRYEEENQALHSEISGDKGLRKQLQDARDQFEKRKTISSKREIEAQKQIDELQAVIESLKNKLLSLEGKCSAHEKTIQTLQQSHESEIIDYQRRLDQERKARAASEFERPFSPNSERGGGDARLMAQLDSPRSPRPGFI